MDQFLTMEQMLMAYRLIKIQITQNGKEIFKGSVPEDTKEQVEQLLDKKIGMYPAMVCSYENIEEFIFSVQNKTADETKQIFNELQEEDKMEYYIRVADEAYDDDTFTEEDVETFERLGLTDDEEETTAALKRLFNIEFNLVINGTVLPLA
ncbi:hypothetical protein P4679_24015 [Priestia megaterium]|uniref:hypothetical protein n=1 Tax=Priestia megaterium TaxID=1404 RepID=UPI002E24E398|nr:hypothetical protein [Priestia megaterium]